GRARRLRLEPGEELTLDVDRTDGAGIPAREAARRRHLGDKAGSAEKRCQQDCARDPADMALRIEQCAHRAERHAEEPQPRGGAAGGPDDVRIEALGDAAVEIGIDIGLRGDDLDRPAPLMQRGDEAVAREIVARHAIARQHHQKDTCLAAARRGVPDAIDRGRRHGAGRRLALATPAATGTPPGALSTAPRKRLRSVPAATVRPISWSTGMREKDSTPKPMTVQRLARTSDATVRSASPAWWRCRSKNRQ